MSFSQFGLGAVVLLPLAMSALTVIVPPKARTLLGLITGVGVCVFTGVITLDVVQNGVLELYLGGFSPPLGIALRADGLSVLFLALASLVGLFSSAYAVAIPPSSGFWPLWLACWAGLNAVFLSGDLFNTYVGLELVGLSAVALVALGGKPSWKAALRYLFVAVLGSLLFLLAVGIMVAVSGSLDISQIAAFVEANPQTHTSVLIALVFVSFGLALKVALVPFHAWLIPAHSSAPGSVSPLLSALVIKAALFVLLRCWMWIGAPALTPTLGTAETVDANVGPLTVLTWFLGVLGALAVIGGSIMALRQEQLKPLVAYSTVAQVGYWFLFFPLLSDPESSNLVELGVTTLSGQAVIISAVTGTVALALAHGLGKASLFLGAGYLKDVYGTDEISRLRGAGKKHPVLIAAMSMSAVGLAGLPISLGFVGKWQLATAAVAGSHYWIVVVLVSGTLLSAAYLLKVLSPLLILKEDDATEPLLPLQKFSKPPLLPQVSAFVLGALALAGGFAGVWTSNLLEVGAPW